MSQIVITRDGQSVEVIDRSDLNKWLLAAIAFLIFTGGGIVWTVATQAQELRGAVIRLDTRVNNIETTLYERRELVRQVDSLRITLREAIGDLRRLRR